MKSSRFALAVILLATSGAAAADSGTDARCILLASTATTAQMKALFDKQAATITDANAGGLMAECVKGVESKIEMMQTLAAQETPAVTPPPATRKPANPQGR